MAEVNPLMDYPPTPPEDLLQYVGPTVVISGGRVAVERTVVKSTVAESPAPLVLLSGRQHLPKFAGRGMETRNVL